MSNPTWRRPPYSSDYWPNEVTQSQQRRVQQGRASDGGPPYGVTRAPSRLPLRCRRSAPTPTAPQALLFPSQDVTGNRHAIFVIHAYPPQLPGCYPGIPALAACPSAGYFPMAVGECSIGKPSPICPTKGRLPRRCRMEMSAGVAGNVFPVRGFQPGTMKHGHPISPAVGATLFPALGFFFGGWRRGGGVEFSSPSLLFCIPSTGKGRRSG